LLSYVPGTPSFVVLGADTYLAARPATPIQLAHACRAAGFDAAVPTTWGDEIIALDCARQLSTRTLAPAVFCACERVRARLLAPGTELTSYFVSTVAPPVAAARYLRRMYGDTPIDITYVGDCPSGRDPVIDRQITPTRFLTDLAERGIIVVNEPTVFQSLFAPDRRRCLSAPGGLPTDDLLQGVHPAAQAAGLGEPVVARTAVELTAEDYAMDLAQYLVLDEPVLIDIGAQVGCVCCGALEKVPPGRARPSVVALEPPRSCQLIVEPDINVEVRLPAIANNASDGLDPPLVFEAAGS
jgi:hypothetical protein